MYIDDEGCMRNSYRGDIKYHGDTVDKQPYLLPGVYDGLWSAYSLVVIFENEKTSEPIKTIDGVRGINCAVKVVVMDDGTIHIDG